MRHCIGLIAALIAIPALANDFDYNVILRERATYASAIEFDRNNIDAGDFWAQRLELNAEYKFTDNWSVNGRLFSGLQTGLQPNPIEQNNLEIQIANVAYQTKDSLLRLGRQELKLGSQRLIGWRDGTNIRRIWDGAFYAKSTDTFNLKLFSVQLVSVVPNGTFNDRSNSDRRIYGLYSELLEPEYTLDLYAIQHDIANKNTIEGINNQSRTSVGARHSGDNDTTYWDWEAVYQFGSQGELDISAWTLATKTGFRFPSEYNFELMLSVNVASGDKSSGDGELNTFDALYPRGSYFSEAAILGPANFYNINPYFIFKPREDLRVSFDINAYWRLEVNDGVYGPPGNIIRRPLGSNERLVNLAYSLGIEWTISDKEVTSLLFTYSLPRDFIEDTGIADKTRFVELSYQWQFN